jgi:sodium-coupled neutral amino acid transporter 11
MQPLRFEVENKQALNPGAATGGASVFSSAVNIAKQQAGVVFLTYADAVNKAGSLVWCLVLLGVAVAFQCASACAISHACDVYKAKSYQDLYEKAIGKRGLFFVQFSIVLNAFFGCVGYCIVVKEYTARVAAEVFGAQGMETINICVAAAVVFFPLAMKSDLNMLRFSSALGLVCVGLGATFVTYQLFVYWGVELETRGCGTGVTGCSVSGVMAAHNTFDFSGLMGAAVIFIGGMMSHYNIPRLYEEFHVKDPSLFCRAVKMAFTANFFIYLIFAFGGFLRFGTNKPTGNLIKFYDNEHDVNGVIEKICVTVIWILMAVQISTSYPLLFNPMRRSLFEIFGTTQEKVSPQVYTIFTAAFVALTVVIALSDVNLTVVMIFKGAICGVALCYLVPGVVILSTEMQLAGPTVRKIWGSGLLFVGCSLSLRELSRQLPALLPGSRSLFLPPLVEFEG